MKNRIVSYIHSSVVLLYIAIALPGTAAADGNDEEDKHVKREGSALPIDDVKEAIDLIGEIFGSDDSRDGPLRASLRFDVQDWAGRPTSAIVHLVGPGGVHHSKGTIAGRATFAVDTTGSYVASLEVNATRGRPGPSRTITVPRLNFGGRYVLRVLQNTPERLTRTGKLPGTAELVQKLPRMIDSLMEFEPALTSPFAAPPGRNLTLGERLSLQGQVQDRIGRPMNAIVVVSQRGRPVGHAHTVGGRFSLFDLSRGDYELTAITPTDRRGPARRITLGASVPRVVLIGER